MPITKFKVSSTKVYTFPTSPGDQEYRDNFKNVVLRTSRLPFADGGFDELGDEPGSAPIGMIQLGIYLVSATREGMQALRDDLNKIRGWGLGRLFYQPPDPELAARWCYAKVNDISIPERRHEHTDLYQKVQLSFQVIPPWWYTKGNCESIIGEDFIFGTSKIGGGTPTSVTGLSTNLTYTPTGNYETQPTIAIKPPATKSVTNPIVRRIVNGDVVDEVKWIGTLTAGQNLHIDCPRASVRLDGVPVYTDLFSFKHPSWMRLLPGDNTIQVRFALSTDQADVNIRFLDRWL